MAGAGFRSGPSTKRTLGGAAGADTMTTSSSLSLPMTSMPRELDEPLTPFGGAASTLRIAGGAGATGSCAETRVNRFIVHEKKSWNRLVGRKGGYDGLRFLLLCSRLVTGSGLENILKFTVHGENVCSVKEVGQVALIGVVLHEGQRRRGHGECTAVIIKGHVIREGRVHGQEDEHVREWQR